MAGTAEVSTSNLRSGASFDNLKATWGKKLSLGDFSSQLDCEYDYNDNKDFIKSASLSGNLIDGSGDDLSLDYEVTKNFGGDKTTEVTLTAEVSGTTVTAELDTADNLKEVGASRSVSIGDKDVTVSPSFLVKAQTARVKLMTALGSKDSVSVQADVDGTDLSRCRMYHGFMESFRGFAKNGYEGLGSIWILLLITVIHLVGHLLPFGVLIWCLATGTWLDVATPISIASIGLMLLLRITIAIRYRQSPIGVPLHPIAVAATTVMQWWSLRLHLRGTRSWRGRTTSSASD